MKTNLKKGFLTLSVLLGASVASADTVDCFERSWIVSGNAPNISLPQLSQAITYQVPQLTVVEGQASAFVVSHKPSEKSNLAEDKAKIAQIFNQLTSMGLIVECNKFVAPLPSLTGSN